MPTLRATILLGLLSALFSSTLHAQACGASWAKFLVLNSADKPVSGATIELLGGLEKADYEALRKQYGYKEPGFQTNEFKIPPQEATKVIGRVLSLRNGRDLCGNPLIQTSGVTKVISLKEYMNKGKPSRKNFGYCVQEGGPEFRILLKITAPGYETDYYAGPFLHGCREGFTFILNKGENRKR